MTADYATWVAAVFDHPEGGPDWYFAPDFDEAWDRLELTDAATVAYLTSLFAASRVLDAYSLPQIARGIWFLIGDSSPAQPSRALLEGGAPLADRARAVRAIPMFFREFVARAAPGRSDHHADPFHIACYMWWDIFPSWGGPKSGEPAIHHACIEAMTDVLAIPSELCQISALHGLNHWRLHHAAAIETAIDRFLTHGAPRSDEVRQYAKLARAGCAQ